MLGYGNRLQARNTRILISILSFKYAPDSSLIGIPNDRQGICLTGYYAKQRPSFHDYII